MKVICEKYYNIKTSKCRGCMHSTQHILIIGECKNDSEICGICSSKPLRKEKLKKINEKSL